MISPDEIKSTLEKALPGSSIEIRDLTGGGDHFQVWIVSSLFEGKGLVDQHQMVYAALKEALGTERIHALSLKTYTPEQWKRSGVSV
ncbi:MAG: BolA family protein [Candidatus Binatia bacterium]